MNNLNKETFIDQYKTYFYQGKLKDLNPTKYVFTIPLNLSLHKYLKRFLKYQELNLKMFGSRYYGCAKENSDFDFLVEYHPFLEESLIADGWKPVKKDGDAHDYTYSRTNVFSVLEMDFKEYGLPKIQLVLVKDFYLEEFLWNSIGEKEYWEHICKHNPEFKGKDYVNNYLNLKLDNYFHFYTLVTNGFIKQMTSDIIQPFAPVQEVGMNEPVLGFQLGGEVGEIQADVQPAW